ncbi:MAG: ATP-dependent DNA helicase RecG [Patescibacteria group bacterium]|nr:ATP-dependent DNA helicase RecG [Patescibacteria group bacterium]
MITLETELTKLGRIGAAVGKKLKKLGVLTVEDLLFYFPFRYDDFSKIYKISELQSGITANIVGQIELIQNKRSPRRRMNITEALVRDESDTIKIVWFNQPFIARVLKVGDFVSLSGKIEEDYSGFSMISPNYEKTSPPPPLLIRRGVPSENEARRGTLVHTQGLVPNYHLTGNLTHKQIRYLIKQTISTANNIIDWLPQEIKKENNLLDLPDAITKIHFPKDQEDIAKARERLAFDELFLLQLRSQITRRNVLQYVSTTIKFKEKETKQFVDNLPFKLTNAQKKAAWEILKDLEKNKPMSRLLEGDVGSGKTVVAAIAMLNVALNGYQAVLMAPTEILAKQHYESIKNLFSRFDIKIGLITSSDKRLSRNVERTIQNEKEKINSKFIINNSQIIIGTHALIQENIKFKNLSLAIIDEQHRFGVEQRKTLLVGTGHCPVPTSPHLLSMTATPIPRSLALALYGDLDVSIINEMPAGRKKIHTQIVPENKREAAYQFIREQIKNGRQIFVICPLIDISDKLGVKSVKEEFEKLDKLIFPEIKMGMLHGKLKSAEKEEIMKEFGENKIKILVSTSVVEVGVDVPNAAIMMIEGADRFGLAQLHQFRGRVGRSEHQSYCFLFTDNRAENTMKRLQALTNCYDGFQLAKIDLKFRGPGEVYGTAQAGFPELKIASLFDYELMKKAQANAIKLIEKDSTLNSWPNLKEKINETNNLFHLE